jgi:cell division protein ZapA
MGSSGESVRVTIFGDEYSIKGDSDSDTTLKIAEYVNIKIAEVQSRVSSRDRIKVAVLSAMNIAGELMCYKEKCEKILNKCQELQKKADTIDTTIEESSAHS